MPFLKSIPVDTIGTVFVWKITESPEALSAIYLNERSIGRLNNMRSEIHQKGFMSIRHLLQKAGYSDKDLYYSEDGKPHLRDGKYISITHSFHFSAIIIADHPVGIDIEMNREKIKKIAPKFVCPDNEFLKEPKLKEQLTVLWGAKEAMFKIASVPGLSFKTHLPVAAFDVKDQKTTGWIKQKDTTEAFTIFFEQIEDYTLVYAHPESVSK